MLNFRHNRPHLSPRFALGVLLAVCSFQPLAFSLPALAPVTVAAIEPTRSADLVMLSHGFNAGLRQGMVCRVTRAGAAVAEVLLVDLRPTCASALIVSLAPGQSIRAGDVASVKILKT
jgi:hypothetical protein